MAQQVNKDLKLGELLRALGAVESTDLSETLKLAVQVGLPLGRALVLAGHLSEDELDAALEIQALMRQGNLTIPVATRAFALVHAGQVLGAALEQSGWDRPAGITAYPSRLGSLLFDAKIITKQQLDEAQRTSYETGMPLGRILGLMGLLSPSQLAKALELQRMVRDKSITHNQAVLDLHSGQTQAIEVSLAQHGLTNQSGNKKTIRLGELLMLSGILNESDIMNALEHGLTSNKPLGDVLLDLGLVTRQILDLALEMQNAVCTGALNIHAATDALHYIASTGKKPQATNDGTWHAALGGVRESIRLGELLKMSGFIEDDDIKQAIDLSNRYPSLIGKMLVVSGAIDEATLLSALRCQFLLRNGHVMLDDAVKALQFAKTRQLSLDDAIEELNISVQS
jgi:hypothetical protein